jgi:hypothetical protein
LAGVFAALALLSGPGIWAGLISVGIAWAIRQGITPRAAKEEQPSAEEIPSEVPVSNLQPPLPPIQYRPALIALIVTFLIVGSLFFMAPNGLGAAFASLPEYLRGWGVSSSVPITRVLASLLVYQPLAVFLAIFAIIRGWANGSRRIIPLSVWLLVTLLLVVFYPSHEVHDLAWVLIPLNALAAVELARHLNIFPEERREVIGVILLTLFILAFAWLDLASLVWSPPPSPQASLRIGLFFGSLALLGLSIVLVGAGWSTRVASSGGLLGLVIALGIFGLGGSLGSAGLRGAAYPELWWPASLPAQADLLMETANNLSEWHTGDDNNVPIVLLNIDSPALEWTLRGHPVSDVTALDPAASPAIVITPMQVDPNLASTYRGQDFIWRQTPTWEIANAASWIRWIVLREMPQNQETVILWARDDLFLDSASHSTP